MNTSTTPLRALAALLFFVSFAQNALAKPLNVSTDIPFVGSLVQAVAGEQDNVRSLMNGQVSPHSFALRPRDMQLLQTADLVVLIGEELSPNVTRTIKGVALSVPTLTMLELPELQEHIIRMDNPSNFAGKHAGDAHNLDPHIWVDPVLLGIMATAIGEQLAQLDRDRAELFRSNAVQVSTRLQKFHEEQQTRWSNQTPKGFVTMHEIFRYFQHRYNLSSAGSLFEDDHTNPSAKHLKELQDLIRTENVECVITDPNSSQRWVNTLTQGQSVKVISLNTLGSIESNIDYLTVLQNSSDAVAECLGIL